MFLIFSGKLLSKATPRLNILFFLQLHTAKKKINFAGFNRYILVEVLSVYEYTQEKQSNSTVLYNIQIFALGSYIIIPK